MYLKDYIDENIEIKNNGIFGLRASLINENTCHFAHSYDEWLTYDESNVPLYTDIEDWKLLLPHLHKVKDMALEISNYRDSVKIAEFHRNENSYYVRVVIEVNKKRLYRNIEITFDEFNREVLHPQHQKHMPTVEYFPMPKQEIKQDQVFDYMIKYALKKLDNDTQNDYNYLSSLITISAEPDNLTVVLGIHSISMTYQDWVCLNDAIFHSQYGNIFDPYLRKIKDLAVVIQNTITKTDDNVKETEMFFDKDGKLVVRPLDRIKKEKDARERLRKHTEKVSTFEKRDDSVIEDYKKQHDDGIENICLKNQNNSMNSIQGTTLNEENIREKYQEFQEKKVEEGN